MGSFGSKANSAFSFPEFPDPKRLSQAQQDYAASAKAGRKGTRPPPPRPPATPRSAVFQPGDFKGIDTHAKTAPLEIAQRGYKELATYLCQPAKNDVGKVRAFYVWIASQEPDQIKSFIGDQTPPKDTPLYAILAILVKGWSHLYTRLLRDLCKEAAIPFQEIRGKVKGAAYRIAGEVKDSGRYCIVYVDGSWRFVDQYWGSSYVAGGDLDKKKNWEVLGDEGNGEKYNDEEDGGVDADATPELAFRTDDFWFLTDPEVMVYTHFHEDSKYQLLARPVTVDEFKDMAYLHQDIFDLGLESLSHPRCMVSTDTGELVMEFKFSDSSKLKFLCTLYRSVFDPKMNVVDGHDLKDFVMTENINGLLRVTLNFPLLGKYKMEMSSVDAGGAEEPLALCSYAIDCLKPTFNFEPNPDNDRDEWGPGADTQALGLDPVSVDGGVINAKDGVAEMRFKKEENSPKMDYSQAMENDSLSGKDSTNLTRHYETDDEVVFLAKLPKNGKYIYKIYSKEHGSDTEPRNVCNYLIVADKGCADLTPYPEAPESGRAGAQKNEPDLRVTAVSHPEPIIECDEDGELEIIMAAENKDIDMASVLKKAKGKKSAEDLSQYVYYHQEDTKYKFLLHFPKAGMYSFDITGRAKGEKTARQLLYQYVIDVHQPKEDCVPFAKRSVDWKPTCELLEPKEGYLPYNEEVYFRVRVPDGEIVYVENSQNRADLSKCPGADSSEEEEEWLWEGHMSTGIGTKEIFLCGIFPESSAMPAKLYTFKVLTPVEAEKVETAQSKAMSEAGERKQELDKRREEETEAAEQREIIKEETIKKKEEEFEENKDKYEEEARVVEEKEAEQEEAKYAAILANTPTPCQSDSPTDESEPLSEPSEEDVFNRDSPDEGSELSNEGSRRNSVDDEDEFCETSEEELKEIKVVKIRQTARSRDPKNLKTHLAELDKTTVHRRKKKANVKKENWNDVLTTRQNLKKAVDSRDEDAINRVVVKIRKKGYTEHLKKDVLEAKRAAGTLDRVSRLNRSILETDHRILTEIRRYQKPPPALHKVMQAALLLLGEDEGTTEEWKVCQKLCSPNGPKGLRKVSEFDIVNVHPAIASRSRQIMKSVKINEAQSGSAAAATFHKWVQGMLKEMQKVESYDDDDDRESTPASIERQREIFGRLTPLPKRKKDSPRAMSNEPWH